MSDQMPPNPLDELAGRLSRRWIEPPSAELNGRIREAVAAELRSLHRSPFGTSWVTYAAGLAAAFVIVSSVSLIAISDTRFTSAWDGDHSGTESTARAIRQLAPELSDADALRLSAIDRADAGLICLPQPQSAGVGSTHAMTDSNQGNQ
jgi:hypothetical protein